MQRVLTILALVVTFQLSAEEAPSNSISYIDAPSWVKQPAIDLTLPARDSPNLSVRYLLSNQQYNIAQQQKAFFNQVVMQPVNENGLQHVAEVSFSFNPKFEHLNVHHITVMRDGVKSNRLVPTQIKLLNEDASLKDKQINGRVTALAILEDIRIGDIISYAYTIEGSNPVLGDKHFGRFITSWSVAIENINLRLLAKKSARLNISQNNLSYIKTAHPTLTEHLWTAKNTEAVAQEDRIPSWYNPYKDIQFSEYDDWKQVNQWAIGLYKDRTLSEPLKAQIAEWRKNLKTTDQQIDAALQFVQDEIRYFGIEMGQNTHKPFSPGKVFDRRYGDCKDKTTLLITILESLGLKAYPALVSSYAGKVLNQQLPSPGVFDHVIVKLEYNSKDYWLDGTVSHQRGGLNNIGFIDYKQALVIKNNQKEITKIVPPKSAKQLIETNELYNITESNDITDLSIETIYYGLHADTLRQSIASNGKKALAENFLNFYSQTYPKIETSGEFQVADDTSSNKITITSHYKIEDWTVDAAGKKIVSLYVPEIRDYLPPPATLVRQHPFYVTDNLKVKYQQTIRSALHQPISFDDSSIEQNNQYFKYTKNIKALDNGAVISHFYQSKVAYIDANKTADYVEQVNQLKTKLGFSIIYPTNLGKPVKQQEEKLKNLAKRLLNNG